MWFQWHGFGVVDEASEFTGGSVTGTLFFMGDLAFIFFVLAALVATYSTKIRAVIALAAILLCLPLYLYVLMPGPYHQIFKGEYSVPLARPIVWNTWAVVGVLTLLAAGVLNYRGLFKLPT